MTIFNRKEEEGQVRVPELEVRGETITVPDQNNNHEENRGQDRQYKLPKTKWF
jgi:hypothetical protein